MPRQKVDMLTAAVLDARDMIVRRTGEMTKVYQPARFMTKRVTTRTMDKLLLGITPDQMMQIAQTDPDRANAYSERINLLEQRQESQVPFPAQDAFEGTVEEDL